MAVELLRGGVKKATQYKIASGAPKTGDPKHSFLAFPESVQKVVGSMSKIGQFFDHLNF